MPTIAASWPAHGAYVPSRPWRWRLKAFSSTARERSIQRNASISSLSVRTVAGWSAGTAVSGLGEVARLDIGIIQSVRESDLRVGRPGLSPDPARWVTKRLHCM